MNSKILWMQWYEKDPCFHRSFSTGTKMKQSKNYLVCLQKMFSNLHDYRISRIFFVHCTKWENSDFTPCRTLMTQFFWTPHAVPRKPKNFRKIGGWLLIWSMPRALPGLKIQPMQLLPHHHVNGFSHMIVIYLLTCWNIFQHVML